MKHKTMADKLLGVPVLFFVYHFFQLLHLALNFSWVPG